MCYLDGGSHSVKAIWALKACASAYLALCEVTQSSESDDSYTGAIALTDDGAVSVEGHFPHIVWGTRREVRAGYIATLKANFSSTDPVPHSANQYPEDRFIEYASVHLKLLLYGAKARAEHFDPRLEGRFSRLYSSAHSILARHTRSWTSNSGLMFGFCDGCGMLAALTGVSPLRTQVAGTCVDCRGASESYLSQLITAGLLNQQE